MMIIVAELIDLEIVPAKKRKNPQKSFVHPFRLEHGAMAKLVMRRGKEGTDRAVNKQRCNKPQPHLLREQIEGDTASCRPEAKMTECHEQPARIIWCH